MPIAFIRLIVSLAILGAVALGLIAPFFAVRPTMWKALGCWLLGLTSGAAGIAVSLLLIPTRVPGQPMHQDMPGFGQVLLAAFGCLFFAAILAIVVIVFAVSWWMRRQR